MTTVTSSAPPVTSESRAVPGVARYTAGYLPTSFGTWPQVGRKLLRIMLVSLGIAVLVNPEAWSSLRYFSINYAFTFAYTAGLWLTNGLSVDWLNARVPWTRQPGRRLALTLLISLLGSLAVIMLVNVLFWRFYSHLPLTDLFSRKLVGQILLPLSITIFFSLTLHARSFLLGWRAAAVRAGQLEKESAVARLDSLRRQVDPHFLFNSLNALTALVEEQDPARAVRFIRQLAQVYRYVLESESQEVVPLSEEIAFAEAYVALQKTRLGNALEVEMDATLSAQTGFWVPPLAVQLLLENAIKHNAAYQAEPLRLRLTLDATAGTLTVRNTLRPRRLAAGEASGRGLQNLAARYASLTDRPMTVGPTGEEFVVVLLLLTL